MRVVLCLTLLLCGAVNCGLVAAPLATLVRAPKYDSAIIQSDRLGGNFAYSTAESHAYAVVSPIVQNVVSPVAVSYTAHHIVAPVAIPPPVISTSVIQAAPVVTPIVDPAVVPQIFTNVVQPVEASADSPPEAEETPAAEEPTPDAPEESEDAMQVESA